MDQPPLGPSTRCVHAGRRATPDAPGLAHSIERSTTFLQHSGTHVHTDAGEWDRAWVYSRYSNPTVAAVEQRLAALEGAEGALLFGSGQAAMHAALLHLVPPGGRVLAAAQLYGGSVEILEHLLGPSRTVERFDITDLAALGAALEGGAARSDIGDVVLAESLSNPTLQVADLPELARLAHGTGARLLVDATFATPMVQRPLELGADLVMHSATKALAGHSDVTAGVLLGGAELMAGLWKTRKRLGATLDPQAAYLLARGLPTLALRVGAQVRAASQLAEALSRHPAVRRVHYPGLESHSSHALGKRVLDAPGSVLAFELRAGDDALRAFVARLQLAVDAPSLGGVETLVSLPRFMAHAALTDEQRTAAGIEPGCVRVACGIEDPEDLVADFERALGS